MKLLDIGEVCEQTGLRPSALRYYEDVGLISSACRSGLRRQFEPDILTRLGLVAMGKSAGFSLDEISKMFGVDGVSDIPRASLHRRADELKRQIVELKAMHDVVRHVANCPAPTHMECPTFRRLVERSARQGGAPKRQSRRKSGIS